MRTKINVDFIVNEILQDYEKERDIDKMDVRNQPDQQVVLDIVEKLLRIIFPGYYRDRIYKGYSERLRLGVLIEDVVFNLQEQVKIVLRCREDLAYASDERLEEMAAEIADSFARSIPRLREYIDTDLQATLDGDPAASGKDEIVLSYPGLYAIVLYRIAHELYVRNVPLIPRMITEHAHGKTGIDINPGATIGKYFFIDHGTGIVVGETTEIGEHVKIYQGVTLGALSTRQGQALRGRKRHPTLGNYVTVYSGASILGGASVIGDGAVIGSNAFITTSVKPGARVSIQQTTQNLQEDKTPRTASQDGSSF